MHFETAINTSKKLVIILLDVKNLIRHEQHKKAYAQDLAKKILQNETWTTPVLVDAINNIILDGHHRYAAAIQLNLKKIPCVIINHDDARITLSSWRVEYPVSKKTVMNAARSQKLLPIKTSKHLLSCMLPTCDYALSSLAAA